MSISVVARRIVKDRGPEKLSATMTELDEKIWVWIVTASLSQ